MKVEQNFGKWQNQCVSKLHENLVQAKHVSPGRDMQNLSHPSLLIYSLRRVMARLGENALYQGCFGRHSLACARLFNFSLTLISLKRDWSLEREIALKVGTGAEITHFLFPQAFAHNSRSRPLSHTLGAPSLTHFSAF